MMINNIASSFLFIVLLQSSMSWKFLAGFGAGVYTATVYDMKPAVEYVKGITLEKVEEVQEYLDKHKKPEPTPDSFIDKVSKSVSENLPKGPWSDDK
jgi:hypothetical protein